MSYERYENEYGKFTPVSNALESEVWTQSDINQMCFQISLHIAPVKCVHTKMIPMNRLNHAILLLQCTFHSIPIVLFLLAIVLSVLLRYTDSDYPFGILKHFLFLSKVMKCISIAMYRDPCLCSIYLRRGEVVVRFVTNFWLSLSNLRNEQTPGGYKKSLKIPKG